MIMDRKHMVSLRMTCEQFMAYNSLLSYISFIDLPEKRSEHIFYCGFVSESDVISMEVLEKVVSILNNKCNGHISVAITHEQCDHLISLLQRIKSALAKCKNDGYDDFEIVIDERAYLMLSKIVIG